MKPILLSTLLTLAILLTACGPSPADPATLTATILTATAASWTQTPSPTATLTQTDTYTPTITLTATDTFTPTMSLTPSETPTLTPSMTFTKTPSPTFDFPKLIVTVPQANCRYGPAKAYLYAGGLYAGDTGVVWNRYNLSNWLFVKMDSLAYPCWVSPSVVQVTGDITTLAYNENFYLPQSSLSEYTPPKDLTATREGDKVTVSWHVMYMTQDDDNGYMLNVFVCQNKNYIWDPVSLPDQYHTTYTFTDQAGCSSPSGGQIASVEKHGYTKWEDIPWPKP